MSDQYLNRINALLGRAKRDRRKCPVIVIFRRESTEANALYVSKYRRLLGDQIGFDEPGVIKMWTLDETITNLRGIDCVGATIVASAVEATTATVKWWLVDFGSDSFVMSASRLPRFTDYSQEFAHFLAPLNSLLDSICPCCLPTLGIGGVMTFHIRDKHLAVCGRTQDEIRDAYRLVDIAINRSFSVLVNSDLRDVPMRVEDLKLILRKVYWEKPRAVAEAIRALQSGSGQNDLWLVDILNNTSALSVLAQNVQHELTGLSE